VVAKLAAKFQKACGVQENFDLSDLRQANGLGLDAELPRCAALGENDLTQCFGAQAFCESGQIIERQVPRARELAAFLNVALPD
jgi:hypothetical protein